MAITVGTLQVDLVANTASFTGALDKAGQDAQKSGADIKRAFDDSSDAALSAGASIGSSMRESREGMKLLEESLGVTIPRGLNSLAATIPGIGAAFSTMLPIIGVIAALDVIVKLIEHHEKLAEAIRKATLEQNDLNVKEIDRTKGIELTNLKLDDQIAKLESRPSSNKLKEALLEASIAADALASSFASSFLKVDEQITDATGLVSKLKEGFTHLWEIGPKGDLAAGLPQVQDGLKRVQEALERVDAERLALAKAAPGAVHDEASKALAQGYHDVMIQAELAGAMIQRYAPDEVKTMSMMAQAAISAASAEKDLNLQLDQGNKLQQVAKLQAGQEVRGREDKTAESVIAGAKEVADAQVRSDAERVASANATQMDLINTGLETDKALGILGQTDYEAKKALIDKETQDHIKANTDLYNLAVDASRDRIAILSQDTAKNKDEIQKLNDDLTAMAINHETQVASLHKKGNEELAAADQAYTNDVNEELNKRLKLEQQMISETIAFDKQKDALLKASAKEEADFEYKMGVTTEAQRLSTLKQELTQEYNLAKAELDKELQLAQEGSAQYQKIKNDENLLDLKYQNDSQKLNEQGQLDQKKVWDLGFNQLNSGLDTMIDKLAEGNTNILGDLKKTLENMMTAWLNYYIQLEAKALEASLFQAISGLPPTGGSGGSALPSFMGGLAAGGPVSPGNLYTVGESGKEWFAPSVAGQIVPMSGATSSGSGNSVTNAVNVHFHGVTDADSFQRSERQVAGKLAATVASATARR